jgi:hypothetical protein
LGDSIPLISPKVKILYITGSPRSGSTILSKSLGQIPGFFHSGELRFLWDKNFQDGFPCECGNQLRDCEIWSEVFEVAYGGIDGIDSGKMLEDRETYTRTKHIPLMLTEIGRKRLQINLQSYLENLDRLYSAIQKTTGCEVIIDSSKFSSYGYILSMLPSVDVYYLHLIRDSRAVAYSRLKMKKWDETGIYMARYSPLRSSIQWSVLNLSSEVFNTRFPGKYLQVKYEEFIKFPKKTIEKIIRMVGVNSKDLSFINNHSIIVQKNHTNWGNPIRTTSGRIDLALDEEWKSGLILTNRAIVSSITLPLLLHYQYI